MIEKFSTLGTVLNKSEQQSIKGGDTCVLQSTFTYLSSNFGTLTINRYRCKSSSSGDYYEVTVSSWS